jgi:hypothetical protein
MGNLKSPKTCMQEYRESIKQNKERNKEILEKDRKR